MYAISNASRVYITLVLLLCAAFFLAPAVANANEYWSVLDRRFIPQESVPNAVKEMLGHKVARPSGSTITSVPSAPTISKNAAGGLSATTNNILKTLDQPSSFSGTTNYSLSDAKNALKSCVRSPACAGRALGAGAIIYEGIQGWKTVYQFYYDDNSQRVKTNDWSNPYSFTPDNLPSGTETIGACGNHVPPCVHAIEKDKYGLNKPSSNIWCNSNHPNGAYLGSVYPPPSPGSYCVYYMGGHDHEYPERNVTQQELDDAIDQGYEPAVSDAPIVLLSGEPETISLTTPEPANLPSTTTTNTDSQGKTTTTVKNAVITYNILNNNSSSPSIESIITETSETYDDTANFLGSSTSTTTNNAVQPDPLPPTAGASADIELPVFCTWAKTLCDWLGWTQEELGEEEPDLSQLITVFEPDEDGFDLGIGSGSCPAPMQLNLGIINKTVEVKYNPFCDFLEMIRPFVLAAAYLFAAYLYVGVLRRG